MTSPPRLPKRALSVAIAIVLLPIASCSRDPKPGDLDSPTSTSEPPSTDAPAVHASPTVRLTEAQSLEVIRTRIADRDRRRAGLPPPTPSPTPRADASILPSGVVAAPSIGLMWTPHAVGGYGYRDAERHCNGLDLGGFTDWRLPTIDDLERAMGADVVVSIPTTARALWTRTPAENRGHVTLDPTTGARSWMDAGLAHVVCVRAIHSPTRG